MMFDDVRWVFDDVLWYLMVLTVFDGVDDV
jgi:hypothetical protein